MESKPVDEEADTLFVIMDDELIPMSEEEIRNVFDDLRLNSEDDRRTFAFDNFEAPDQTRIEIQVLTHTGTPPERSNLLNA
jgi:hypothetical protein